MRIGRAGLVCLGLSLLAGSGVRAGAPFSAEALRLDVPGGSMEGLPVYSQTNGTCYAYSGALAIDAWRKSHRPLEREQLTNPFELAVGNGQLENGQIRLSDTVSGGSLCSVVKYARKKGVCPQGVLPLKVEDGESLGKKVRKLGLIQDQYKKLSAAKRDQAEGQQLVESLKETLLSFGLEQDQIPSTAALESALLEGRQAYQRQVLTEPSCGGRRLEVESPEGEQMSCRNHSTVFDSSESIIRQIEARLTSPQSLPVGIAYCSHVLKRGPKYTGFSHRVRDLELPDTDACGGHVSVVIGKRLHPETGKREFLIQNSWGKQCGGYSPAWECDKGKIWIDAEALARNTYAWMSLH